MANLNDKAVLITRLVDVGQKLYNENVDIVILAQYVDAVASSFPELDANDIKTIQYLILRMK